MKHLLIVVVPALLVGGCANKATGPSGSMTMTFTRETSAPADDSASIVLAQAASADPNVIALAVYFNNVTNPWSTSPGFTSVAGRVTWDDSKLAFDSASAGDLMTQGGVTATCCTDSRYTAQAGTQVFSVSRASLVSGSGEVVVFRLKRRDTFTAGSAAVGWGTLRVDFGAGVGFDFPLVFGPNRGNSPSIGAVPKTLDTCMEGRLLSNKF